MAEESSGDTSSKATSSSSIKKHAKIEEPEVTNIHGDSDDMDEQDDLPYPGFVAISMCCLPQTNWVRAYCLRIITWPWFERMSMAVIVLNCITLGMYQPCTDIKCDNTRCKVLEGFDHFIFAFFLIEMLIKMISMGIWGKTTYLAESWNRLDCFIVLAGTIEYSINNENLSISAIRTIRVLRPLRAINRIPSMRILVMLLLDTLPMLGNVLLLCFFVFFIFGIIGVQLWSGVLRNRCTLELPDNISHPELPVYYKPKKGDFICSLPSESGMRSCDGFPPFKYQGIACYGKPSEYGNNTPTNSSCVDWNQYYTKCVTAGTNPYKGAISFDNIGLAWVAIFQVISLESWVNIMYFIQDAHSFWDWIYFVALIVIGSFFMINLCLVVIATQFSETKKRETERMMQERKRFQSSSTLASNSEPGGCYVEILKYIGHQARHLRRKLLKIVHRLPGKRQQKVNPEYGISLRRKRLKKKNTPQTLHLQQSIPSHTHFITSQTQRNNSRQFSPKAPRASPEASDLDSMSSPRRPNYLCIPTSKNVNLSYESLNTTSGLDALSPYVKSLQSSANHINALTDLKLVSRTPSFNSNISIVKSVMTIPEMLAMQGAKTSALATSTIFLPIDHDITRGILGKDIKQNSIDELNTQAGRTSEYEWSDSSSDSEADFCWKEDKERRKKPNIVQVYIDTFHRFMTKIVESKFFSRGILLCILFNSLSMGIEYHKQPLTLTDIIEISNIVFCCLFAVEMLFKILAYGIIGYIRDGFNLFDSVIVIISIVELVQGGDGGLSVLRTFRLLRILKLVRFLPALRRQLVVMLRTIDNVATFFGLLVLFMFIFSILGMNLFGGRFCSDTITGEKVDRCLCQLKLIKHCECDRTNFDSLLWSLITVFQVLTQEDWNTVLYNGMEKTSAWASLYFIALMTFGNYVLFNLLVAILVEGFSTDSEEKKKEKEKEREKEEANRLLENNNNEDSDLNREKNMMNEEPDEKNNQEKERKMLALPPHVSITKDDNLLGHDIQVNPPIITHTAATPMATPQVTPQGSPHEVTKEFHDKLTVTGLHPNTLLSVDHERPASSLSVRSATPLPSPKLQRQPSKGSIWSINRNKSEDEKNLVGDDHSESGSDTNADEPIEYKAPVLPLQSNNHNFSVTYVFNSNCNGRPPLNNQRPPLSPQNSLKDRTVRNNSIVPSLVLSRQNSINSRKTFNSGGSGTPKEDYRPNDLSNGVKDASEKDALEEEDPDAMDEANCALFSYCPEPKGCFKDREEYALYIFHPKNRLRMVCHHLIARKWFDYSILVFIGLNCITLAMERPKIPPGSAERKFLTISNYIFTAIFAIEMTLKVIAKGFAIGRHAYLKSGWNVMDGFLVIISLTDTVISLTASSSPKIFGILRVFRLLRTLRPLRVISRAPGLKLVVQTLLSSLRPIGNIVLICATFFIIFGILGVQLFKGTFYRCIDSNMLRVSNDIVSNASDCEIFAERYGYKWVNQKYNFDNLGQALIALFVLASKDGWVNIMYTGLDAVGVDQQPIENYSEWRFVYFISFILLVGFFVLNMFVGVVVENFHKCRENQEIEERAMRAARRAKKMDKKRKKLKEAPYWSTYSRPRLIIHTIVSSKYFDLAIAGVIGLNVVTMAMEYYMMPDELKSTLKIFNYFFTCVFIMEAAMKVYALGIYLYFKDRWNQLDMMIVILSIIGIILEEMKTNVIPINPTIIRVMRVLRIARVLKLLKMAKGIRALLDTVIQALPQVGNLGLLFFLLFFIFAALGVELYGRLECSYEFPCEGLGPHAHFHNFGMAFLTLFRVATGDNWNGIMKDTLRENCDDSDDCTTNCCVSHIIAPIYFVVFVLMAQFVLVNVVVAVLMKHLEESHKQMAEDAADEREMLEEDNNDDKDSDDIDGNKAKELLSEQMSLPPNFTVNVRPPSTEPHSTTDNEDSYYSADET